jgi:uncharacterized protein YebE (UPF0316 family)
MSLYLHIIWIHWPQDFEHIEFDEEGTDEQEAWLAIGKQIMKYLSDRKEETALLELIIRLTFEDFVSSNTQQTHNSSWSCKGL